MFYFSKVRDLNYRKKLLDLYEELPFEHHPHWIGVLEGTFSYEEVIRAEIQHCLRTKAGQNLRRDALQMAQNASPEIFATLLQTYIEECTEDITGPSHLDLIRRLVIEGGVSEEEIDKAVSTPGNAAAIALYRDIAERGAGCHILGAGTVEHFYCQLSPKIYRAYTENYGMSDHQAETYRIHGPMDHEHAERAFSVLNNAINLNGWASIETAVRDAFVATSLHYDGMFQAATREISYWDGKK